MLSTHLKNICQIGLVPEIGMNQDLKIFQTTIKMGLVDGVSHPTTI